MSALATAIVIDRDGDEYTVRIDPDEHHGRFDASYPTHRAAATYCRMLGKLRDWTVCDLTGEADPPRIGKAGVPLTSRKGGAA